MRNSAAVLGNLIQGVRPGVCELTGYAFPHADFKNRLQRIVVGGPLAVHLENGAVIWIDGVEVAILVEIFDYGELAALASDVTQLKHRGISETLFDVQVVVNKVRSHEILVYTKHIEDLIRAEAVLVGGEVPQAGGHAREYRFAAGLDGVPVVAIAAITVDGTRSNGIVLQTVGARN